MLHERLRPFHGIDQLVDRLIHQEGVLTQIRQTSRGGEYLISYPNRVPLGGRFNLSPIPANYTSSFIVTPLPRDDDTKQLMAAVHYLQVMHAEIFGEGNRQSSIVGPEYGLQDKTQIKNSLIRLHGREEYSDLDRDLLHLSQFLGSFYLDGRSTGSEFRGFQNHPDRWQDSNLIRRWSNAISFLTDLTALGRPYRPDQAHPITQQALLTKHSAETFFRYIDGFDLEPIRRTLSEISPNDYIDNFLNRLITANTNGVRDIIRNLQTTVITPGLQLEPEPSPQPESSLQSEPEPERHQETPREQPRQETPNQDLITEVDSDSIFSSDPFGRHLEDSYHEVRPVVTTPEEFNLEGIQVISPEEFQQLERMYPTGGIEVTGPNIQTTQRSIEALKKLRALRKQFEESLNPDEVFYKNLGYNALPFDAFDFVEIEDYNSLSRYRRQALALGGALVDHRDGKDIWLLDSIGQQGYYLDSFAGTRQWFDVTNVPTPDIDFANNRRWELLNFNGNIRDLIGKGYIVPIKENKAIFLPASTALDFSFGVEWETNIHQSVNSLLNQIRNEFGYNLSKMGFHGSWNTTSEASLPRGGTEYISPAMSGVRAFKAGYMFGEALKWNGADIVRWRQTTRNDPIGIHVNVGTIPTDYRTNAIKFMADYLRLVEDVYKKMTSPNARYRYFAKPNSWPWSHGVVPNYLPNDVVENIRRHGARQFWAQDISAVRQVQTSGGSTMSEYEFYRRYGKHYGQIADHATSDIHRLAKYKTIAIHKLQSKGILENRTAMFVPGGDVTVAHMVMTSKLAKDIYQGSIMMNGALHVTDKLVPPQSGWNRHKERQFKQLLSTVFDIKDPTSQEFVWQFYNKCREV